MEFGWMKWMVNIQTYKIADLAHLVERRPSKSEAAGSSPAIRSWAC
jgi:hypothetical protein